MSDVMVFERTSASFAAGLAKRGHHIVYRTNAENHCPGCGRSHWYIGRISAECGFCGTAIRWPKPGTTTEPPAPPRSARARLPAKPTSGASRGCRPKAASCSS